MTTWALLIPTLICGLISVLFIFCQRYDDGLLGRISLGGIGAGSLFILIHVLVGEERYSVDLEILLFVWATAAFMLRHAVRWAWFTRKSFPPWERFWRGFSQ